MHQILTSDLFDLPTTLTPELESKLQQLDGLEANPVLTEEKQAELHELRRKLESLLSPPGETKRERETYERLGKLVQQAEALLAQWPSTEADDKNSESRK